MKKILMLSTGGTIASTKGKLGLTPKLQTRDLLDRVPAIKELCKVESKMIMQLDSTNIQPEDWQIIAENVYVGLKDYDGIVITHGTDTLAYTAAALCFMIQNVKKPVILTGSQIPIEHEGTDAIINMEDAFRAATCNDLSGIHVVFGGRIIQGTRASKIHSKDFDAYRSINIPDIGSVKQGKLVVKQAQRVKKEAVCRLKTELCTDIALIKLIPGTDQSLLEKIAELGYKGVIIESFGNGGLPFVRRNLLPVIERLINKGILVAVTTQCLYGGSIMSVWDVGIKALNLGVIPTYDMATEALTAKMMWVLGQTDSYADARRLMETNIICEISI